MRKICSEDLLKLNILADPEINPPGDLVVFSNKIVDQQKNRYDSHLHLADLNSNSLEQITFGEVADSHPQWSPDGTKISFIRSVNSRSQIWTIELSSLQASQITELGEGSLGNYAWSPRGEHIVFEFLPTHIDWTSKAEEEREARGRSSPPRVISRLRYKMEGEGFLDHPQHLWVLDVSKGKSYQITHGEWDDRDPAWSPDGKKIAFISNRSNDPDETPYFEDIWIVSKEGGNLERVAAPKGYKKRLAWSPDGKMIAYAGSHTEEDPWAARNDRLWLVPIRGGKAQCLTASLDRVVENATVSDIRPVGNQGPVWSADGKSLLILVSDRGSCHVYRVTLEAEIIPLLKDSVDVCSISTNADSSRIALMVALPTQPPDLYLAEVDKIAGINSLINVSHANWPLFRDMQFSDPEEIWIKSYNGIEIQGWVYKPPDFDPGGNYPLTLYIHGGPDVQYGFTYFHEFQVLAANGYVVLITNPRGSLGREEDFATCIQGNWGDKDYQDLMVAADYGASLPYVDASRMAVLGGSYGGTMVSWTIGHTDRFCCAVAERGVYNRHSAVGTSDFPPMPGGYWEGNAWDNPEKLWQQSPLRLADKIRTPLLIIHSEGDQRCVIEQAEQLFAALKNLKREVVFLRYPGGTNHGFSRQGPPDLRVDRLNRILDWLNLHLK